MSTHLLESPTTVTVSGDEPTKPVTPGQLDHSTASPGGNTTVKAAMPYRVGAPDIQCRYPVIIGEDRVIGRAYRWHRDWFVITSEGERNLRRLPKGTPGVDMAAAHLAQEYAAGRITAAPLEQVLAEAPTPLYGPVPFLHPRMLVTDRNIKSAYTAFAGLAAHHWRAVHTGFPGSDNHWFLSCERGPEVLVALARAQRSPAQRPLPRGRMHRQGQGPPIDHRLPAVARPGGGGATPPPRHPETDTTMPIRYSPERVVIADTPAAILEWAALHVEHVGIHQGPHLFAGPGRTATLPCWPRGALEVAAGHGRGDAGRTYDWDRIEQARDQAFGILAETLTGHPVEADEPATKALHREVIDRWSAEPGRTAADAARAFRTAAVRAEHALF